MRYWTLLKLALYFLCSFASTGYAESYLNIPIPAQSVNNIEAQQRAVVRIFVRTAQGMHSGSGFLVSAEGQVATNKHILDGAEEIFVCLRDQGGQHSLQYKASVSMQDAEDLAILQLEGELSNLAAPLECDFAEPSLYDEVVAIGYPGILGVGLQNKITQENNIIEHLKPTITRGSVSKLGVFLVHDAEIAQGGSGGPLISLKTGKVIGINHATAKYGSVFFLAIYSKKLAAFLNMPTPYDENILISQGVHLYALAASPDHQYIAAGGSDKTCYIIDVFKKEQAFRIQHQKNIYGISFSPNGKYVATASYDGSVIVTDVSMQASVKKISFASWVKCLAFSPNGEFLAVAGDKGNIKIYECTRFTTIYEGKYSRRLECVAFSPDSRLLVAGSSEGDILLFNTSSRQMVERIKLNTSVNSLSYSPDGNAILAGCENGIARIYSLQSGTRLNPRAIASIAMQQPIYSLAWSRTDNTFAISSTKGQVSIYSCNDSNGTMTTSLLKEELIQEEINAIAFTSDGTHIIVVGQSGYVLFIPIDG